MPINRWCVILKPQFDQEGLYEEKKMADIYLVFRFWNVFHLRESGFLAYDIQEMLGGGWIDWLVPKYCVQT